MENGLAKKEIVYTTIQDKTNSMDNLQENNNAIPLTSRMAWWHTDNKARDISLIFLIVLAILLFRRYDSFSYPQIWDEDGVFYLYGYETYGIRSLVMPGAGYFVTIPHIVSNLFGILSVNLLYIPLCYNLSAFFITFLVAVRLYYSAVYLKLKHKIVYAVCFLLTPIGPDMFMNITNIMWVTSLYLIDFIFVGHKHGNNYLNFFFLILVSMSSPSSLMISPLIILFLLLERKKFSLQKIIPFFIILLCGLIQFISMVTYGMNPRYRSRTAIIPSMSNPPEHLHLLKLVTNNIQDILFLHNRILSKMPSYYTMLICMVFFLFFIFLYLKSYNKISFQRKYVLLIAPILFLSSYVAAFWPQESKITAFIVSRYYFVPYTCIAWIFILAWDKKMKLWHIALYLLFFLKHSGNMRSILYDKQWRKQILEYYQGTRDTIYINEGGKDWGWQFTLPKRK